jgi:hypothetical protein
VKCILMPRRSSPMNSLHTHGTWTDGYTQHSTAAAKRDRIINIAGRTTPALSLALLVCMCCGVCLLAAAASRLEVQA